MKMKKTMAIFAVMALMVCSLAACGKGKEGPSKEPSDIQKEDDKNQGDDTKNPDEQEPSGTEEQQPNEMDTKPQVTVVSRYTFDNMEGTVVPDEGANGYAGNMFGSPETVEGKFGTALKLSGSNGVTIPVGAGTVGRQFTASAWIKIDAGSPQRPYRILSTGVWGDNTSGFQLGIATSYGNGCFVYCVGNAGGACYWNRQAEFSAPIMDGQWHHIAIAFDMDAMLACGFLDGALMDIMTLPASSNVAPWSALSELSIGGAYVDSVLGESFVGVVDELCVVNYFFTEADVKYLMDNTVFE